MIFVLKDGTKIMPYILFNNPKTFKTERGCPFLIKRKKRESTYNNKEKKRKKKKK